MDSQQEIRSNEIEFAVFCIENIACALEMNGNEIYHLLTMKDNIIEEYILANYEILHTQGKEYIVNDVVSYMKECGVIK